MFALICFVFAILVSPFRSKIRALAERLRGKAHLVALGEGHLCRILQSYARYYNELRTHRSLNKDSPIHRAIEKSRYYHFTVSSRWTSPPILPNLIFGTHTGLLAFLLVLLVKVM